MLIYFYAYFIVCVLLVFLLFLGVTISAFLMVYVGFWAYGMWAYYADSAYLSYLSLSIISLLLLILYSQKFIKKYKNI